MAFDPTAAETAAFLVGRIDLTRLGDDDTEEDIRRLCARAVGPLGAVAAVCVWPRFAALARRLLPPDVGVAAVVNFPDGELDVPAAAAETDAVVEAGAQEIDVVLPYRALQRNEPGVAAALLAAVRARCPAHVLKVILETGELRSPELVARASDLAIAAGADFLKTSTGKTAVGATLGAARVMLQRIAAGAESASRVGFKASGGIRTPEDALAYANLQAEILGPGSLGPARFRLGASSLLDAVEAPFGTGSPPSAQAY